MPDSPLWAMEINTAADALRRGEITSVALTEALLDRIAAVEQEFHAFALLTPELALSDAARADRDRAEGSLTGPLQGIPLAVKDAIDDADAPACFGNPILHAGRAGAPSAVIDRLVAAGAVRLGKLTLTEGVWVQHHESVALPINPHGAAYWTGNSSSGSGVALAAGMAMGSVGTDTGGSIRLPCGSCGITGLKPTWGRISVRGVHPLAPSFDHVGPMARTARDTAILMDALAGHDPADPTSLTDPAPRCAVDETVNIEGLKVGLPWHEIAAADDAVRHALETAAETFRSLGAKIVPLELPDPEPVIKAWSVLISAEAARVHSATYPARAEVYGTALTDLIERGRSRANAEIIDAMAVRRRQRGEFFRAFGQVDVALVPALPVGGPSNAFMDSFASDDDSTQIIGRYTVPFSMSGFPTLTLPCGKTSAGIPIGMQICGLPLGEPLLCRVGAAYQDATGWHGVAIP